MAVSQQMPWSDDPNAPQITYSLYQEEKIVFVGTLISAIFYGMLTPNHPFTC